MSTTATVDQGGEYSTSGPGSNNNSNNPLRVFVSAKKDINDLFIKVETFVKNVHEFYRSYGDDAGSIVSGGKLQQLESAVEKVAGIRDVLSRNHMKVAFFGRTSNGKSTVINAILQNKILPAGIGHTTNCFLQVEGTDEEEPFIEVGGHRQAIDSVKNLANALNNESMSSDTLVKIFWPKSKCSILHDDVVLVDSPGTDVSANLDSCIDLYCLDADVFVLVSNSESTLMQTEKNFFLKVKEKLSKPNIFILNNRWDASALETDSMELVRKQHMTRDTDFLVDELAVVEKEAAEDRVFFVSARETLFRRTAPLENGASLPNLASLAQGHETRYSEFEDFEHAFEQCLSQSAVKTKFSAHTAEVSRLTTGLAALLEEVAAGTARLRAEKLATIRAHRETVAHIQKAFQLLHQEVKQEIVNLMKAVEHKVCTALNEEIRRLAVLVADFEQPFAGDAQPLALAAYKKELHGHVEARFIANLEQRFASAVSCNVGATQAKMLEGARRLLPPGTLERYSLLGYSIAPREDFKVHIHLNCESLCSDFVEDLQFRFSYGLVQLLQYLTGGKVGENGGNRSLMDKSFTEGKGVQLPSNSSINDSGNGSGSSGGGNRSGNGKAMVVQFAASNLDLIDKLSSSRTTITLLAVGGCLVRVIGWHVIAITSTIYGLLYVYERLSWTTRAKETAFKRQYVAHATKKLRLIVDYTSDNCSDQVKNELTSSFVRLNRLVDNVIEGLRKEVVVLEKEVAFLDEQEKTVALLRGQVKALTGELQAFTGKYLL
ncbi:PREDICTED: mitofusin-2-like [Rhagoletis zephyria]|uniref:mitofusin-2-like n=1 Tax=Rhagoletis zephyria TaxID=28612 RepID=UPI00081132D0|nr:PREDICTED: mitofusin-2-like [Rhagoletis zephyria]